MALPMVAYSRSRQIDWGGAEPSWNPYELSTGHVQDVRSHVVGLSHGVMMSGLPGIVPYWQYVV